MKKKLLLAAMLFVMTITSCVPYNTGNDASDTDTSTSSALTEIVTSETEKETSSAATTTAFSTTSVTESATRLLQMRQPCFLSERNRIRGGWACGAGAVALKHQNYGQ